MKSEPAWPAVPQRRFFAINSDLLNRLAADVYWAALWRFHLLEGTYIILQLTFGTQNLYGKMKAYMNIHTYDSYLLGRHASVTIAVIWLDPTYFLSKCYLLEEPFGSWYHAWGNFTRDQPWPGKLFRPLLRPNWQALVNLTNDSRSVGSEPSISVAKLFHSAGWATD